ncbi:MAG: hypothetical protein WC442_06300 [Candidatus Omnitrophota bacterium]
MNKNMVKNIVIILLVGITGFSMVRYISEVRQVYLLRGNLNQAKNEIAALIEEKRNLLQDIEKEKQLNGQLFAKNLLYKDNLRASSDRIKRLFKEKAVVEDSLEERGAKLAILKAENKALIEGRKKILTENEQYKARLSSVVELRKAIDELKKIKNSDPLIETQGNRGFLIKDGKSTVERVKIEVIPAQIKE